jgi:hypothetical protein
VLAVERDRPPDLVGVVGGDLRPAAPMHMHVYEAGQQPAPRNVHDLRHARRISGAYSGDHATVDGHPSRIEHPPRRHHPAICVGWHPTSLAKPRVTRSSLDGWWRLALAGEVLDRCLQHNVRVGVGVLPDAFQERGQVPSRRSAP